MNGLTVSIPTTLKWYQTQIDRWMHLVFPPEVCEDKDIRNYRFLEEALELVQAGGCTRERAYELVDYVYGRPVGEKVQEVGGVMVTLAGWCEVHGVDLQSAAMNELERVNRPEIMQKIRDKQASKVGTSALPGLLGKQEIIRGRTYVLKDGKVGVFVGTHPQDAECLVFCQAQVARVNYFDAEDVDIDWQATFVRHQLGEPWSDGSSLIKVSAAGEPLRAIPVNTVISDELSRSEVDAQYHLNSTASVAVSNSHKCSKDMSACPRGTKVYLIGQGGVGVLATYDGLPFWIEWAALPGRAD